MNFISLSFWFTLALLLVLAWILKKLIRSDRYDRWILLAMSIILFASESYVSFLIFLFIVGITYVSLILIQKEKFSPFVFVLSTMLTITPLLFFKYAPQGWPRLMAGELLIPIGISFYTFQLLALVVDYRKRNTAPISGLNLLNFATFFPQIVAGPIERKADLMPQIEKFRFQLRGEAITEGVRFIILGFFYKLVLADNIASISEGIHGEITHPLVIHFSNFLFGLRIYGDFCGYSLIAYGLARCLGVELKLNFLSPYTACNIQDFWRTWHITLSNWFRDYIYIPLGGNRTRYFGATIILVFVISGVWHGAGWNFLLWGLLHGLGIYTLILSKKILNLPKFLSYLITMSFTCFTWLFFYQLDRTILFSKVGTIFDVPAYFQNPVTSLKTIFGNETGLVLCLAFSVLGIGIIALEYVSSRKTGSPYGWSKSLIVQIILILTIVVMSPVADNGFVYFNF